MTQCNNLELVVVNSVFGIEFYKLGHFVDIGKQEVVEQMTFTLVLDGERRIGTIGSQDLLYLVEKAFAVFVELVTDLWRHAVTDIAVCITTQRKIFGASSDMDEIKTLYLTLFYQFDKRAIAHDPPVIVGVSCADHGRDGTSFRRLFFCLHGAVDNFVIATITAD